ncbi:glutathione S-transferase [Uliginosibacterium paludis]|uniref:Glutathione S-transferase n=1 Tax=Uliginosibacterium paludis TaxID=1615952 RepID=A0ABV2CQV1_9RHOO
MQLIGMLDSPYVRRSAISMLRLGLRFEHQSISVFRQFPQFQAINPVVKAPSLVCDDGAVLMDSTLIIQYAEACAGRSLMPATLAGTQAALQAIGLALAVCEKSVQIIYERNLRPTEKQHTPWLDRVSGQLQAALAALEAQIGHSLPALPNGDIDQAGISLAVAWHFAATELPAQVRAEDYPRLAAFSAAAEALPAFRAAPHGDGIVHPL